MKRILLLMLLFSCSSQPSMIDEIFERIGYTEPEMMNDGSERYIYYGIDDAILTGRKIKGIVDRNLNVLPYKSIEFKKSSFANYHYDQYEWETPTVKVVINTNTDGKIAIDITNK
jgi:hypothetical protein